jgi:hypothetical protein
LVEDTGAEARDDASWGVVFVEVLVEEGTGTTRGNIGDEAFDAVDDVVQTVLRVVDLPWLYVVLERSCMISQSP